MDPLTQVIAQITWDRLWGTKRTGRTRAERYAWIRQQLVEQERTGLGTGRRLDLAAEYVARSLDNWQSDCIGQDAAGEPLPPPTPYDREFAEDFAALGGPVRWDQVDRHERDPRTRAPVGRRDQAPGGARQGHRARAHARCPALTPASMAKPRQGPDWGPGAG